VKHIWLLLGAQATKWKKRKTAVLLIGIVLIIGMISTFSYVKKQERENETTAHLQLGVANEDSSEYANLLISYFLENDTFSSYVTVTQEKEELLNRLLEAGELDAYLVIPKGFAQSLIQMDHVPMKAVVSMRQPTKALIFRQVLEAYETYIKQVELNCTLLYEQMLEEGFSQAECNAANVEISIDLIFTALGKDDFFRIREIEKAPEVTMADHYAMTILFFAGMFFCLPAGLSLWRLRQNGMILRLRTMGISAWKVSLAIAIPYLMILAVIVGGCAALREESVWYQVGTAILLLFSVLCVCLFFGAWLKKRKDYLFAFGLLLISFAVLGGGIVPKRYLPSSWELFVGRMPNERFVALMAGIEENPIGSATAAVITMVLFFTLSVICLQFRGEAKADA